MHLHPNHCQIIHPHYHPLTNDHPSLHWPDIRVFSLSWCNLPLLALSWENQGICELGGNRRNWCWRYFDKIVIAWHLMSRSPSTNVGNPFQIFAISQQWQIMMEDNIIWRLSWVSRQLEDHDYICKSIEKKNASEMLVALSPTFIYFHSLSSIFIQGVCLGLFQITIGIECFWIEPISGTDGMGLGLDGWTFECLSSRSTALRC